MDVEWAPITVDQTFISHMSSGGRLRVNFKHLANHVVAPLLKVVRDIDELQETLSETHHPDLGDKHFQEVSTPHPTVPGRMDRSFDMTKDGFTLLAMGFTGQKALAFKWATQI